ncbi:MAG TPA: ABC transporter permease [Rhodothermales bacterium]|nr:ABC transporter permease [Rhodothermales bacterium]
MLRNYVTLAIRNLRKHAAYTFINVIGLTLGIACCLLILIFVKGELGFDRFHENASRLYRLDKVVTPRTGSIERDVITSGPMGPALAADYPEVEQAVRVLPWFDDVLTTHGETSIKLSNTVFADSNFFDVFSFGLLRGDPSTALAAPLSIVLSEETAHTFFGEDDPVGRRLIGMNGLEFTVTGIVENTPTNSHLLYDAVASWSSLSPEVAGQDFTWLASWFPQAVYTYLLLAPEADAEALEVKLVDFMRRHFPQRAEQYALYLQPLSGVYLDSSDLLHNRKVRAGNRTYVYLFAVVAALVLLIACINFMNLSTARAAKRAREVGVRKVLGASRGQLIRQFLGESFLTTAVALILALWVVELAMPGFRALTAKPLVSGVWQSPAILAGLVGVLLGVGLMAGAYPAFFLSGFRPVHARKGGDDPSRSALPRQVLVTLQFTISIALIVGTIVVYRQMDFLLSKDLGFKKDQIVVLPIEDTEMSRNFDAFKQMLLDHPSVTHVTGSNRVPGEGMMSFGINPEGKSQDQTWTATAIRVDDFDFLDTYGLELVAGRYFDPQFTTDSTHAVVINEALARSLGWDDPVGKRLDVPGEVTEGTVIGVVKDFHFSSLRQVIEPLLFYVAPRHAELSLRISGEDIPSTLAYIRRSWETFDNAYPFEYKFLDEAFARLYHNEQRLSKTLGLFSGLAILIACLGLFGLASYTTELRAKEVGLRKLLGATVESIVLLLSKEFARLVVVALAVATPIAYVAMQRWLADFAYRVELSWWIFPMAGGGALAIALVTVSYQSVRTALANPVRALRYE